MRLVKIGVLAFLMLLLIPLMWRVMTDSQWGEINPAVDHQQRAPFPVATESTPDRIEQCSSSGLPAISSDLILRGLRQRADRSDECTVDLSTLISNKQLESILIADTRSPSEYARLHIKGSINLPLFSLKTKNWLQEESLVLVNNGESIRELIEACLDLRDKGFSKTRVLINGIKGWKDGSQQNLVSLAPIVGDLTALKHLDVMTAQQFADNQRYRQWILVHDESEPDSAIDQHQNINYRRYQGSPGYLARSLQSQAANKGSSSPAILLALKDPKRARQLGSKLTLQGIPGVYTLKDGLSGLKTWQGKQKIQLAYLDEMRNRVWRCGDK